MTHLCRLRMLFREGRGGGGGNGGRLAGLGGRTRQTTVVRCDSCIRGSRVKLGGPYRSEDIADIVLDEYANELTGRRACFDIVGQLYRGRRQW